MAVNKKFKQLRKLFATLDEVEFRHLEMCFGLARNIRTIKEEFHLTDVELAKELDISIDKIALYINAAYDYTIEDMAKIHATYSRLSSLKFRGELMQKLKTEFVDVNTSSTT